MNSIEFNPFFFQVKAILISFKTMSEKFWKIAHAYEVANLFDFSLIYLNEAKKSMPEIAGLIEMDVKRINKLSSQLMPVAIDFINYEQSLRKQINKIKKSGLFDTSWFLNNYKRFDLKGMDPLEFFVRFGNSLCLDPNKDFSTEVYIAFYGGKWVAHTNAFYRYLNKGGVFEESTNAMYLADKVFKRNKTINGYFEMIENVLPSDLKYTLSVIKANEAITRAKEEEWLNYFNEYLSNFVDYRLKLNENNGTIFERMYFEGNGVAKEILGGDLITVIMPAWNAEETIKKSAFSILNQTWKNIELIIVDDASTDDTYRIALEIAKIDSRVKVLKNSRNVGPYVSKNYALAIANGQWITGHDADDFALPNRLEFHIKEAVKLGYDASITYMIRMRPDGFFDHLGKVGSFSFDGVARKASITCLFKRDVIFEKLGYWDSVRYGADSEFIDRAEIILKGKFGVIKNISMVCLSLENSLTNNALTGVRSQFGGMSPVRVEYRSEWSKWHEKIKEGASAYIGFPNPKRHYIVPKEMDVLAVNN